MPKTWLITGASRGLGQALARVALERGDQVVATARSPEQMTELLDRHGSQVRLVALDVTDPAAANAAVEVAVSEFGGLDVVANNAGYANSTAIEDTSDEDFRSQIETNLFGVINVTRAALPVLRRQQSGHFLQYSSIGGRVGGTPGLAAYQTAKFAVEGFSEVLRAEVAPFGIKVTIVEPGAFRTDWQGSSMIRAVVSAGYDATVGEMNRFRESTDGKQAGDPIRAAQIVFDITRLDDPPVRLLLGAGALAAAGRAAAARAAEAEAWADVSRSADYPTD